MPDRAISMSQPTFYVHIRDNPPKQHFGGLNDRWRINGRNKKTIFAAPFPQEGRLDERLLLRSLRECFLFIEVDTHRYLLPPPYCLLPSAFCLPPCLKKKSQSQPKKLYFCDFEFLELNIS